MKNSLVGTLSSEHGSSYSST